MKQITITIQVPDGVNVNVNGGQSTRSSGGGGNSGFTPQPDPEYPNVYCPVCESNDWRLIKAGFSKTKKNPDGSPKRFNAFYVCNTEGCDGKPQDGQPASDEPVDQLPF